MNLRGICRERDYTTIIGTTYSFNPLFFERVILPDLRFGYGREIVIIGDGSQLSESINRCSSQLKQIGNSVVIEPVYLTGAFHPKILLKIGKENALLTIGSGNMTNGGWGDNREIFTKWELDKNNSKSLVVIKSVINSLLPYISSELALQSLYKSLDSFSGVSDVNDNEVDFYITEPDKTLVEFLLSKWQGKKFHTLKLFTGSTDENGAFIEWCYKIFGINKCVIASNEYNISFRKDKLENIPVDISISPITSNDRMHGKFYLFEGDSESCVVMGSANCSRRAWLLPPNNGGNVEAIAVYNNIDLNDFQNITEQFPNELKSIKDFDLKDSDEDSGLLITHPYKISSLTIDGFKSELRLDMTKSLPEGSNIEIIINEEKFQLTTDSKRRVWYSIIVEKPNNPLNITLFGDVVIKISDEEPITIHHWINDIVSIKSASKSRQLPSAIQNFLNSNNDTEYHKALREIAYVSNIILDDPDSFDDPIAYTKSETPSEINDKKTTINPLTSESLFRSMADISENPASSVLHTGQINTSLSFSGLMNFFFSFQDELRNTSSVIEDESEIDEIEEVGDKISIKKKVNNQQQKKQIDSKMKLKLKKQMDEYFLRLRSEAFRTNCTVSQLKQATAFPLVIAVFGNQKGWVDNNDLEKWVTIIIDILFKMNINTYEGLIDFVRNRFLEKEQLEVFNKVLGDGTLWVALLTGIDAIDWEKDNGNFNKAFVISSVLENQDLISSTDSAQMKTLIDKHKFKKTADWIISEPIKTIKNLERLRKYLDKMFQTFITNQIGGEHKKGDLIYGKLGWGTVQDDKVKILDHKSFMKVYMHVRAQETSVLSNGYFINLRIARNKDDNLNKLIKAINDE